MLNLEILEIMKEKERREVILSGIEGHICV
jgi:hypothetical protein